MGWIMLSLSNILSKKPIWTALSISTLLYACINEDSGKKIRLASIFNKNMAFCQESKQFVKYQLSVFKENYIVDELQRCQMDSSYKRAITSFEEDLELNKQQKKGIKVGAMSKSNSNFINIMLSDLKEFELLKELYS